METRTFSIDDPLVQDWIVALPSDLDRAKLFREELLWCCDEAVTGEYNGQIVGCATIAPDGEMGSGPPTILDVYVLPEHRYQGFGSAIFRAAVRRCLERGFTAVQVPVISDIGVRMVEGLPRELSLRVDVDDRTTQDILLRAEASQP